MDHDQLLFDLKQAPSLRLLRSPNAALILSFLHRTFKRDQRISIPLAELVQWLDTYLELLNEQQSGLYPLATSHSFTTGKPPAIRRKGEFAHGACVPCQGLHTGAAGGAD